MQLVQQANISSTVAAASSLQHALRFVEFRALDESWKWNSRYDEIKFSKINIPSSTGPLSVIITLLVIQRTKFSQCETFGVFNAVRSRCCKSVQTELNKTQLHINASDLAIVDDNVEERIHQQNTIRKNTARIQQNRLHNAHITRYLSRLNVASTVTRKIRQPSANMWLQTGTDGELLLPIVLTRTGGSKC